MDDVAEGRPTVLRICQIEQLRVTDHRAEVPPEHEDNHPVIDAERIRMRFTKRQLADILYALTAYYEHPATRTFSTETEKMERTYLRHVIENEGIALWGRAWWESA